MQATCLIGLPLNWLFGWLACKLIIKSSLPGGERKFNWKWRELLSESLKNNPKTFRPKRHQHIYTLESTQFRPSPYPDSFLFTLSVFRYAEMDWLYLTKLLLHIGQIPLALEIGFDIQQSSDPIGQLLMQIGHLIQKLFIPSKTEYMIQ